MKPSEILRRAREILEPEGAWTQRSLARAADGVPIHETHRDAACWCSLGAIYRTLGSRLATYREWGAVGLVQKIVGAPLAKWNDDPLRTHDEVLDAFRRAEAEALRMEALP